jgi:hypothetical protein
VFVDLRKTSLDFALSFEKDVPFLYKQRVHDLVKQVISSDFFNKPIEDKRAYLNEHLPLVNWSFDNYNLSIIVLTKHRFNASLFLYDLVSRWLVPQRTINIDLFFTADFQIPMSEDKNFSVMEIAIKLSSQTEVDDIKANMRSLETEIRLGISSDYHAKRILEFKGLSNDRKVALIQEKIGSLIQSHSKDFGQGIFSQMQHFLVTCPEDFKSLRDYHHISRIISNLHQIRRLLKQKVDTAPQKRHLFLKFLKTKLHMPHEDKYVLGILAGMNFLNDHEIFEKEHLVKAIRNFIPDVKIVENSFFEENLGKREVQAVYLEVEKQSGLDFAFEEIQHLRFVLPNYLKDHVQKLVHPIFMPRNEEEIMRNIRTLSEQLKLINDIPQIIISFDQQTVSELSFTVILMRVLKPLDPTLSNIFEHFSTKFKFVQDRVKIVGALRKKYFKEANVFRVLLNEQNYLRGNILDLNKARSDILSELNRIFGDVRDYNGGMMEKQNIAFDNLKVLLKDDLKHNETLLEKFFYALMPQETTAIVDTVHLKGMFLLLLTSIQSKMKNWVLKEDGKMLYLLIAVGENKNEADYLNALEKLFLFSQELFSFKVTVDDVLYLGYGFACEDQEKQKKLSCNIKQALDFS